MSHKKAISKKASHFLDRRVMPNIYAEIHFTIFFISYISLLHEGCMVRSRKIMDWNLQVEKWSNFFLFLFYLSSSENMKPRVSEIIDDEHNNDLKCEEAMMSNFLYYTYNAVRHFRCTLRSLMLLFPSVFKVTLKNFARNTVLEKFSQGYHWRRLLDLDGYRYVLLPF